MKDYISRDGLLWSIYEQGEYEKGYADGKREAAPVVHAEWLMNSDFPDRLICSKCGAQFDCWHWETKQMKYCPNCGAKMYGGTQDAVD